MADLTRAIEAAAQAWFDTGINHAVDFCDLEPGDQAFYRQVATAAIAAYLAHPDVRGAIMADVYTANSILVAITPAVKP